MTSNMIYGMNIEKNPWVRVFDDENHHYRVGIPYRGDHIVAYSLFDYYIDFTGYSLEDAVNEMADALEIEERFDHELSRKNGA